MAADPIIDYILTDHAVRELKRRGLGTQDIDSVQKIRGSGGTYGRVVWFYSPNIRKVELNIC